MFYFFNLLLVLTGVNTKIAFVKRDQFTNDIDLTLGCGNYTDCYNCTLAACGWGGGKCMDGAVLNRDEGLSVANFLQNGKKC